MSVALLALPLGAQGVFQQPVGGQGIVAMEAESFQSNTPQGVHQWTELTDPQVGYSGSGVMVTTPNAEANESNYVALSPRLDYQVNFTTTGPHYVHIRGYWSNWKDDSVHVGINGQAVASADDVHYAGGTVGYVWNSVIRTIDVPSTGIHTVNVWMREDGSPFDKIVLSTDPSFKPSGIGPPETPQSDGNNNQPPVALDDSFSVDENTSENQLAVLIDNGNGADFDPDGDPLTITGVGPASSGGSVAVNGSGNGILYTPGPGFTGIETFGYTLSDGTDSDQGTVSVTVQSTGGGGGGTGAFQQNPGGSNIVSIEAENFHANTAQGDHQWIAVTDPQAGFSGAGAMTTTPNLEENVSNFVTQSPRLDYQVNFAASGVHYLHVRGYWGSYTDDSVHVGLNGQALNSADDVHYAGGTVGYVWNSVTRTINVPSPGIHTVNVWMREDGSPFDKIVLSTDSGFVPSGTGPAESGRTGSATNQPPVARDDAFVVDQDSSGNVLDVLADNGSGADSDPDGDALTVVAVGGTSNGGTATVNASQTAVLYSPAPGFSGIETFSYTLSDGVDTDTASVSVTVDAAASGGGPGVFQQSNGGDFIVSIEAENFGGNTPQGAHQWIAMASPEPGYSGTGLMITTPNVGDNVGNFLSQSPRLDYEVNFATAGVHYIHVRGFWSNGNDDSVHVGLNGQAVASADDLHYGYGTAGYIWSTATRSINVPSPGLHTINVWMREDGTPMDKLVLTASSSYQPAGAGPVESPRVSGGSNQPPEARDDAFSVSQDSAGNMLAVLADNGNGVDFDPEGASLSVTAVSPTSAGGAASVSVDQSAVLYTPSAGFSGTETFSYTVSDGEDSSQASVTVNVNPVSGGGSGSGSGPFQQSAGGDFILAMEAENFHLNTAQGAHQWINVANPPQGYSGSGTMTTTPNIELNESNYASSSPRLDYDVTFATTGIHYIHVRGYWENGKDDSVHLGIDGVPVSSASDVHYATGTIGYVWNRVTRTIEVNSTGPHTINLWMREDASPVDKIVLTTNPDWSPSGAGPAESFRENLCDQYPSVTLVNPLTKHMQSASDLEIETVTCLDPQDHATWGLKFELDGGVAAGGQEAFRFAPPYSAQFTGLAKAEHTVEVIVVDGAGNPVDGGAISDLATEVGVGDYYVAIGDSITNGTGDDIAGDDTSLDGRDGSRGYPPILNDLLTAERGYPHAVRNEGVGGITSAGGLGLLPEVMANHPEAIRYLVKYGMNDARPWMPVPSGLGLQPGDSGYLGSFKDNMQQIIEMLENAGKEVVLAKVNIALADGTNATTLYPDPNQGARSLLIQEYNQVIDELIAAPGNDITIAPPDFYSYFEVNSATEYADPIHPNGTGYQSMANLWLEVLVQ